MASFDDLGRALRDDADASAPPASRIDVDAVIRAARARRRPRRWAVGTLSLVAVLGVGGLAVSALVPPALIVASESADTAQPEVAGGEDLLSEPGTARVQGLLSCGAVPPAPDQGPIDLALEVRLPSGATAGAHPSGTVRVINTGQEPRTVITASDAEAVILQGGVVVGEASTVDAAERMAIIDPGVSLDLPVRVSTLSCIDGAALPAGEYTVLALVDTRRSADEPASILIASEWPLRIE
ncbi:hypothetical protein [Microcella sp.]|uniref:hypothetical protein n=1 Tax=Microcella sp. TaxID=1913979 RepID=UPI003F6E87C9